MNELDRFKRICRRYLVINDTPYTAIIFGTIIANRLDSKPVWLYIVGAPGSGKTEILQSLILSDEVILRDTVTRPSLIPGYMDKKTKRDESLIPQLNGKNLIITDFTTILQMNYKNLN